jgi:predicted AAA+ superfamily ATPase
MAHITEFSIEGLAGRSEVYSQKLNRDINVFFGLNGSGKTTLLKILHSVPAKLTFLKICPFKGQPWTFTR